MVLKWGKKWLVWKRSKKVVIKLGELKRKNVKKRDWYPEYVMIKMKDRREAFIHRHMSVVYNIQGRSRYTHTYVNYVYHSNDVPLPPHLCQLCIS